MNEKVKNVLLWVTIPLWFIPAIIYYLWDWSKHQEDYLKGGKNNV